MNRLLAVCTILLASTAGRAGEKPTSPEALAKAVAPFVDDMTVVVAHADLGRVDVARLFQFIHDLGVAEKDMEEAKEYALGLARTFRAAGVRDVFVVYNWDAPRPDQDFLVVVPVADKTPFKAVETIFTSIPALKTRVQDGAILFSTPRNLERMKGFKARERPGLGEALAAFADHGAKAIALPPPIVARALTESFPKVPANLGGGTSKEVIEGLRWLGAGLHMGEKIEANLIAQASNPEIARRLNVIVNKALDVSLTHPELKDVLPGYAKLRDRLTPQMKDHQLVVSLDETTVKGALGDAVGKVRGAAARAQSTNNLKQLGLAFHGAADVQKGKFPAAFSTDAKGKPLLSWRVHLLPYIEQQPLYNEFKLDEPWDSEHNKKLIPRMPKLYHSPLSPKLDPGKTTYLVPTGPKTIFASPKGMSISKITDGTSNTILILETNADRAVFWTQPEDYPAEQKDLLSGLILPQQKGFLAAFADGSVRMISSAIRPETLRAVLTASGGEVVAPE